MHIFKRIPMETPGALLKRAREQRGITLQDLSAITRIPASSLGHIECDSFDELPAEVFVRGFIRNVSRELGLAGEAIIDAYEIHTGREHTSPMDEAQAVAEDERAEVSIMQVPQIVEAQPKSRSLSMPSFDKVVDVVGSMRPSYVIATLILLLGAALTISVMANGIGAGPNLSLNNAPPAKASWDIKADGGGVTPSNGASWITKGQTSNLAGAATLDLSRPKTTD
jgi:transcriptional regulator with XRE-family HTH domain